MVDVSCGGAHVAVVCVTGDVYPHFRSSEPLRISVSVFRTIRLATNPVLDLFLYLYASLLRLTVLTATGQVYPVIRKPLVVFPFQGWGPNNA